MNIGMILVILAIAAGGAALYFFVIKKKSSGGTTTAGTVLPTGWSITNSKNMPAQMTQASDGSYFFDFPNSDGVHYVVKPAGSLQLGQLVTLNFNVDGPGIVVPVQGDPPAKVSLFMQRKGDNLSGAGAYQQYRYWHQPAAPLVKGDGTLACTLTVEQWTDVEGISGSLHESQFAECVINAEMIGMTFGDPGAGAAGHGAYSSGSNRFTIKSFTVA